MSQVMESDALNPGPPASAQERRLDVEDMSPRLGILEDESFRLSHRRQGFKYWAVHGDGPRFPTLGIPDENEALNEIHVRAAERENFAAPHPGIQGHDEDGPQRRAGRRNQPP